MTEQPNNNSLSKSFFSLFEKKQDVTNFGVTTSIVGVITEQFGSSEYDAKNRDENDSEDLQIVDGCNDEDGECNLLPANDRRPIQQGKRKKKENRKPISVGGGGNKWKSQLAEEPQYSSPFLTGYFRPWRYTNKYKSGMSTITYGRLVQSLQITLDVSQFSTDSVIVKPYGDSAIAVEAVQHSTAVKMGTVSRSLARIYKVPPNIDLKTLTHKIQNEMVYIEAKKKINKTEHELYKPAVKRDKTENVE